MTKRHYAAIDQGTTGTRVLVFDDNLNFLETNNLLHKQIFPQPGWVEHDAMEILANIYICLGKIDRPDAIGLDHQGESVVAWDSVSGLPIYNAIIWQDQRTQPMLQNMRQHGIEPDVMSRSGLPLDAYFSASKLGWIMRNVPKAKTLARQGALMLGTMDSFFMFYLTGNHFTDFNSASRTSLFNIHTLQWDEELCRIFDVPIHALPLIHHNVDDYGVFKKGKYESPMTACIVDQFAGIYGHECQEQGDMKITFGTGAFLQILTGNSFPKDVSEGLLPTLCWKFSDEKPVFGLDGGVYNAASAINWAKNNGLFKKYNELNALGFPAAITSGVAFVPALSGLGCPYWDRTAAGLWAGLSLETSRDELLKSILEGIAMRSLEVVESMRKVIPKLKRISVDGGVVKNPYFKQFIANILQQPIAVPKLPEMTAKGTAMLARKGLGIEGAIPRINEEIMTPDGTDYSSEFNYFKTIVAKTHKTRRQS